MIAVDSWLWGFGELEFLFFPQGPAPTLLHLIIATANDFFSGEARNVFFETPLLLYLGD